MLVLADETHAAAVASRRVAKLALAVAVLALAAGVLAAVAALS